MCVYLKLKLLCITSIGYEEERLVAACPCRRLSCCLKKKHTVCRCSLIMRKVDFLILETVYTF